MRATLSLLLLLSLSCNHPDTAPTPTTSPTTGLPLYTCHRATSAITVDGKLSDPAWSSARWTHDLPSILGFDQPKPAHRTRCKFLYDDENLYIAAELDEPHLWATDATTKLYSENAFEIFLDPKSNGRDYWEIEINPKGAVWIINMPRPYSAGGRPLDDADLPGLKCSIHLNGTLNEPSDTDRSWTVELSIPFSSLGQRAKEWRFNLARVDHKLDIVEGSYRKDKGESSQYSAFSPPGEVNLHIPESFAHLVFAP